MKKYLKSILSLVSICAVVAVMLAITNAVTAPIIEKAEAKKTQEALRKVLPLGENFESVDAASYDLPDTVVEVYRETAGAGYVFKLKTKGYSTGFLILCGVNADGTVGGALTLSSGETLGYEKTFGEKFKDKSLSGVENIDAVSGATKTTAAYKNAVLDALCAAEKMKGAESNET